MVVIWHLPQLIIAVPQGHEQYRSHRQGHLAAEARPQAACHEPAPPDYGASHTADDRHITARRSSVR